MASLQEMHAIVQELCAQSKDHTACVKTLEQQLNKAPGELKSQLSQLSDLNYIVFSRCGNYIRLTESGVRARPLIEPSSYNFTNQ